MRSKKEIILEVLSDKKVPSKKVLGYMYDAMGNYAKQFKEALKECIPLLEQHGHHRTSNKIKELLK